MRIVSSMAVLLVLLACGGGDGPPTGNNTPVAAVTISGVAGTSIEVGENWSLSATPRDAQNNPLSGRAIAWSASPQGRVTLSSTTGASTTVTGVTAGSVTISATSEGRTGSATFAVVEAGQAPLTATVSLGASSFNPSSVTIKSGGTVTWTNNSGQVHDITWDGVPPSGVQGKDPFNSGTNHSGTFGSTGTFDYRCTRHAGMNGAVTVVP